MNSNESSIRKDAFWFGESQSRVVITASPAQEVAFKNALQAAGVPFSLLGKVTAQNILIDGEDWGTTADWKNKYDNAIGNILKNSESADALSAI